MDNKTLSTDINAAMDQLLSLLSDIDKDQLDVIPFEGSWTAGQLAQHLILSGSGLSKVMNGPVKDTGRPADQLVQILKADFLNFDTKLKSPPFIVPEYKSYDKEELLATLTGIKKDINQAIDELDLSQTCLAFEMPVYGFLTRLEMLSFVLFHTQRHIHQLKKIMTALSAPKKIHKSL